MAQVIIDISPDGKKVAYQVEGVKGAACVQLTEDLTQALGGVVESQEHTKEYNDPIERVTQQRAGR